MNGNTSTPNEIPAYCGYSGDKSPIYIDICPVLVGEVSELPQVIPSHRAADADVYAVWHFSVGDSLPEACV